MDIKKEIEIAREQMINFEKYQKFRAQMRFKTLQENMENLEIIERLSVRITHLAKRIYDLSYAQMAQVADEMVGGIFQEEFKNMKMPFIKRYENGAVEINTGELSLFTNEAGLEKFDEAMRKDFTMGDWDSAEQRTNGQIKKDGDENQGN